MAQLDNQSSNLGDEIKKTDQRLIENSDREEQINVLLRKKLDKQGDIRREGHELIDGIVDELIEKEINNIMEILSQIGGDWLSGKFKYNDSKGVHYDMTGFTIPDIRSKHYTPDLLNRLNNFEIYGGISIPSHIVIKLNNTMEKKREDREIIFAGMIEEAVKIENWPMIELFAQGRMPNDSFLIDYPDEVKQLIEKLENAGIPQDEFIEEVYKKKEKQDIEQSRNKILATR